MKIPFIMLAAAALIPSMLTGQNEGAPPISNAAQDSTGAKTAHRWAIGVKTQTISSFPGILTIEKSLFGNHSLGLAMQGAYDRDPYGGYQHRYVYLSASVSWVYRRPAGWSYLILSPGIGYGYSQDVVTVARERITGNSLERDEESSAAVWGGLGLGLGKRFVCQGQRFAIEATVRPLYADRQTYCWKEGWYSATGDSAYTKEYSNYTYSLYGRLTEAVSVSLLYLF